MLNFYTLIPDKVDGLPGVSVKLMYLKGVSVRQLNIIQLKQSN